ncbi:MAG: AAA family ATPase, partial [Robiginitomaculum sp.]
MGTLRFDQIRLTGFKSFVEPTDFKIQRGLTGIVGPNGCGKSNLLEAIRWVMGANSAKAMRGGIMDDVIFSGTQGRPGRNQADVVLFIDNSARLAPPMFNDDDKLEVTRIIKKGGGSTYKVNGKTVRAKDVQLLFADASTGANSPALVRQGQINELISAKPSNRRRILEEAAGISGLHSRRHEAELRLRAAETNLDRLDDVIGQIESQLLSLRRQSRQASRYKRLAGDIREYKALLWLKRWQLAIATLGASKEEIAACEIAVADTAKLAASLTTQVEEIAAQLNPKREEQLIAAGVYARLNAAREALENDEESAKGEVRKLEQQIENLGSDITRERSIVEDAAQALARLGHEFETLSAVSDTSAAIEDAQIEARKAIETRSAAEGQVNELTRKSAEQAARRDSAQRDLSSAQLRADRLTNERTKAQETLDRLMAGGASAGNENLFEAALTDHGKILESARN